ncbi:MAG: 50S ribosomal protein L29 [Patescibacteria group bacterium]
MAKKKDISKMTSIDLKKAIEEKRKELAKLKGALAGGKTTNTKAGRDLKKEIARLLTKLNLTTKDQ